MRRFMQFLVLTFARQKSEMVIISTPFPFLHVYIIHRCSKNSTASLKNSTDVFVLSVRFLNYDWEIFNLRQWITLAILGWPPYSIIVAVTLSIVDSWLDLDGQSIYLSPQIIVTGRPHLTLWRYFHHSFCNGNDDIYYLGQKDNVKFDNSNGLHYCCIMYSKTLLLGQAFNSTQIVSGQFLISIFVPHSCAPTRCDWKIPPEKNEN